MTKQQKRNLFKELKQGIEEINAHKAGEITLRSRTVKKKLHPKI